MQVPKDFAARVQGICTATPREAMANILLAMLPREPVTTRPPAPVQADVRIVGGEFPKVFRAPSRRVRKSKGRSYKLLVDPCAAYRHRAGTWTREMVHCILRAGNTEDAAALLRERDLFPGKTLDFNWAEKVGYIAF